MFFLFGFSFRVIEDIGEGVVGFFFMVEESY